MILIVTLNPILEYRFYNTNTVAGKTYRDTPCKLAAGGKGINVSRQLKQFGISSYNVTFLGTFYGKKLRESIAAEGLEVLAVKTADDSRMAHVLVDGGDRKVTSFFTANSVVTEAEAKEMMLRLDKMIQNCEIVVFSGSSPSAAADAIFPYGIELANKYDKVSVLDTYGNHLAACYQQGPTVVHNTVSEVEHSLGRQLHHEEEKAAFLQELYNYGVKQSFLTDGAQSFYTANHDYIYKVQVPEISAFDATGSGDAFTAGIVKGWFHDLVFDEMLRLAVSLGAVNAETDGVCSVSAVDAFRYVDAVTIETVGKKMRIVDTRPTIYG